MNDVYIIRTYDGDDFEIYGVYSTKEKAEEAIRVMEPIANLLSVSINKFAVQ